MGTIHNVYPPASEAKFIGEEPVWHNVVVSPDKYNYEVLRGLNWHNYCASMKNFSKYLEEWVKEFHPVTAKKEIAALRDVPDNMISTTVCAIARMNLQGLQLSEKHLDSIERHLEYLFTPRKRNKVQKEQAVTQPSVYDRMKQQVSVVLANLDGIVDDMFDGKQVDADTIKGEILSQGFKGPQLNLVMIYLNRNITEWTQAYNKVDEQLVEGYSYVGRRNFKRIIDTFTEVKDSLSQQQTSFKAQKVRRRKPVDKKKLAAKLRFMPAFAELNLKSANAVDIIGANAVWVYDTKKRKLGYYEGEAKNSLYVQGTKIAGFKVSCEKILRKPEEQLPQILALRKNQTLNWFDGIKAKCKPMTGRTNTSLILLRVD
jgi:hypothetical protein